MKSAIAIVGTMLAVSAAAAVALDEKNQLEDAPSAQLRLRPRFPSSSSTAITTTVATTTQQQEEDDEQSFNHFRRFLLRQRSWVGQFFDKYHPVDLTRRPTAQPTRSARRPSTTLFSSSQQLLTRKPTGGGDVASPTFEPKSPPAPDTPQPTTFDPTMSRHPSFRPSVSSIPSSQPSSKPSSKPSSQPSSQPSVSDAPSSQPSSRPSAQPSSQPSVDPTSIPSYTPTLSFHPTITTSPSSVFSAICNSFQQCYFEKYATFDPKCFCNENSGGGMYDDGICYDTKPRCFVPNDSSSSVALETTATDNEGIVDATTTNMFISEEECTYPYYGIATHRYDTQTQEFIGSWTTYQFINDSNNSDNAYSLELSIYHPYPSPTSNEECNLQINGKMCSLCYWLDCSTTTAGVTSTTLEVFAFCDDVFLDGCTQSAPRLEMEILWRQDVDWHLDCLPTDRPSVSPTEQPSTKPSISPTSTPSIEPSEWPTTSPSSSQEPTTTQSPTVPPSLSPTFAPTTALTPSPGTCNTTFAYTCLQNAEYGSVDDSRYNIDLSLEVLDVSNADAYVSARLKWMDIIIGNLPARTGSRVPKPFPYELCGNPRGLYIDDLHICGRDDVIDGRGRVLGSAGPTYARGRPGTVIAGNMRFDIADVQNLVRLGLWETVILHEMGHVIGFGPLWRYNYLIDNNLNYLGPKATEVWSVDWSCVGTPPVEKDGGPGTRGGHWDESCLRNEFMTGYLNQSPNPISKLTIASIEDLGYQVNYSVAGKYDGSDTICCNSAGIFASIQSHEHLKPPLSDDGMVNALAYGRQILKDNHKHASIFERRRAEEEDLVYVGDKFVTVLYMENDIIYDVHVTPEQ